MARFLFIGGSSGIGLSAIHLLSSAGHHVTYISRTANENFNSSNVEHVPFDIRHLDSELPKIDGPIDGLVYCPGSINLKPFKSLTRKDFEADMELNFYGAVRAIQAYLENLKIAENPSIIMFSTVASKIGMPFHASVASSKAAVEGLTLSLAAEFAPKIRVNAIAPSLTNTPLANRLLNTEEKIKAAAERHPLKKVGEPNDLAAMIEFLLSDKSKWITGQIFHIDGGMSSVKS